MAKYYFDIINAEGPMRDDEGLDLPNTEAMRAEVARIALDIAKDEITDQNSTEVTVNVRDGTNCKIYSGRLSFNAEWSDW